MGQIANPTSVTLSTSNGVVYLSWSNGDAYTSVIIYRNTSNSQVKLTEIDGAPTSFQDQPGSGTFYYWVQGHIYIPGYTDDYGIKYPAQNLYSDAVASSPAYVTVSPPGAPSIPTLGILTTTSVPMKIVVPCSGGGSGTLGYKIERSTDGTNYTQIATAAYTGSTVNYEDKDINPSTLYYYRIKAYNDYGESSYSSASSITSASVTAPSTPTISLTAGDSSIDVSITPGADQSYPLGGFKLAWSTSNPPTNFVFIGNTRAYTITGLTNSTTYYVQAKQVDIKGNESSATASSSATPTSGTTKPTPPGAVSAQLTGKDTVRLQWSPGIPPSGSVISKYFIKWRRAGQSWTEYDLWQGFVSFGLDASIDGHYKVNNSTWTNVRLADWIKGTKYEFCIYSCVGSGTWSGSYSPVVSCWVGPAAMGTISVDQLANTIVKLKWAPIGGADFYVIERKEARQSSPGTWGSYTNYIQIARVPACYSADSASLETYIDNTLQAGVKYQWRITPYDKYGNTNTSAESSEIVVGGQAILDPDWCRAEVDWDANNNPIIHVSWGNGYVAPPRLLSKYQLTRNSSPSLPGSYIIDIDGTVTQFTDAGTSGLGSISAGTTYYYGVRTKDDLGNVSGWEISNAVVPRNPSPPSPPTNLVAYAQGNSIIVTWTPDSEADATILYRSTDGSSYSVQHAGASTTLSSAASAGATSITVASYSGLAKGDFIYFEDSGKEEVVCITATVTSNTISVTPLHSAHSSGVVVKKAFSPANSKYTETGSAGTKIYFKAKSAKGYLFSVSYSNVDYAVIGEPSRPVLTVETSGNNFTLRWSASVPGVATNTISTYEIKVNNGSWIDLQQTTTSKTYTLGTGTGPGGMDLNRDTAYTFYIRAKDSSGYYSQESAGVTAGIYKPNPPANLVAFTNKDSSGTWYVYIQWGKPTTTTNPVTYYKLYRKVEGGSYTQIGGGNITDTFYTDPISGLSANTRYYYKAVAYDSTDTASIDSNVDSVIINEPSRPILTVTTSGNQFILNWSASSSPIEGNTIATYKIAVGTSSGPTNWTDLNQTNTTKTYTIGNQVGGVTLNLDTLYYWQIKAVDSLGIESQPSPAVTARIDTPGAPENLVAFAQGNSVIVQWTAPSVNPQAVTGYVISRKEGDAGTWNDSYANVNASTFQYTDSNVTIKTKYYYRVKATSTFGSPSWSNIDSAYVGEPSRPTLTVTTAGNKFTLNWNASSPGIQGNYITDYLVRLNGGSWVSLGNVTYKEYTIGTGTGPGGANLNIDTAYTWELKAKDNAGLESEISPVVTAGIYRPKPPGVIAFGTGNKIRIQITAPPPTTNPIASYKIWRDTTQIATPSYAGDITVYDDTPPSTKTVYTYKARAVDTQGYESDDSSTDTAAVFEPTAPVLAVDVSNNQFILTWNASTPRNANATISDYKIAVGTSSSPTNWTSVGLVNTVTYAIGSIVGGVTLNLDTLYYWRIKAIDSTGLESEPSASVMAQVSTPASPENLVAFAQGNKIIVEWSSPAPKQGTPPITSYTLARSVNDGSWNETYATGLTAFRYEDSSVSQGSKYAYKVKAISVVGSSPWSNTDYAILGEPSRPTAQASVVGNDIVVTWTKSVPGIEANAIAHYHFYWRQSGGTWSSANQVSGTSANLSAYTTIQQNVYYEFKVEAEDSAGLISEASPIVTCGIFKPNPPTNLVAFAQQESGVWYIFVQWSAPEQTTYPISYYKLYRKPEGGSYTQIGGNITATVYKDAFSGLTAGTRYYYYVVAYDTQGLYSNNSNVDSAVVGEPEKPTNVRAVMGDGQATVYWSASTPGSAPLDHYHVWMSTDGATFSKVGDNLNADPNAGAVVTQYTKTGLNNGQNYWFKVSVIDKAGIESEYSETVQTRPYLAPNPPRNPRATAGHLEIHLSWDKPE